MTTLGQRLKSAREAKNLTQEALASLAGTTKQALSRIETDLTKKPTYNLIVKVAEVLGTTAPTLLNGKDPADAAHPYPRAVPDREPKLRLRDSSPNPISVSAGDTATGYVRLSLLAMEGAMGHGTIDQSEIEVVQHLDVAKWWAQQNLPGDLDRVKVISSRGDSMAGLINHGDVVFVDTGVNFYDGEGIYVFNWQGRALIKRLAPNLRTGQLQILSHNAASYPPESISTEEIEGLHISGRVVAWWTLRRH